MHLLTVGDQIESCRLWTGYGLSVIVNARFARGYEEWKTNHDGASKESNLANSSEAPIETRHWLTNHTET
jgi:hypothetical protein